MASSLTLQSPIWSVQGVVASLGGLGKLNHVAIAVPSLEKAIVLYRDVLGADVGEPQVRSRAATRLRGAGAIVTARALSAQSLPEHGVTAQFVKLPNTKIELLQPLGEGSPIAGFLEKNSSGGIHHICVEVRRATGPLPAAQTPSLTAQRLVPQVADVVKAIDVMKQNGYRVLNDPPKTGAHDLPVTFLHPKDSNGTLIELEQVGESSQ